MKLLTLLILFLTPLTSWAAPEVTNEAAGNVTTTSFTLCWETGEAALPGIQVFSDASATQEITTSVSTEHQYLLADRREVASNPDTRLASHTLRANMNNRGVFLSRISGLQPATTYWARGLAVDQAGTILDSGQLVEVTTARDSAFLLESRQLVVNFSAAAPILGDLSGAVVRLATNASAYPLFAVINDGLPTSLCYFDLNHLLDPNGELPLNPPAGTNLDLSLALLGTAPISGQYDGNTVPYDSSLLAASSSTATFTPVLSLTLLASANSPTALLNHPTLITLQATDPLGNPLPDFNRALVLESAALPGGTLTTPPLVAGQLNFPNLILNTLGNQTILVRDPLTETSTSLDLDVITYTYENFRTHYFGNNTSPEGALTANLDGDPFDNRLEFAFGLNPTLPNGTLQLNGSGNLLLPGGPLITLNVSTDGIMSITFLRHKNYQDLGLTYTPQFSADLSGWSGTNAPPTVLHEEGEMELVSVAYPYFTPQFQKPRFFRISVTLN